MTELISLQIGFENCEVLTFSAKEVASININSITKQLSKVWSGNNIRKQYSSSDVTLVFPPDLEKQKKDRLFVTDIVDITIIDSADVYCVNVIWNDDEQHNNKLETVSFLSDGSLVVVISDRTNAETMRDEINEKIKQIDEMDRK